MTLSRLSHPNSISFGSLRLWLLIIAVLLLVGVIYLGQSSQAALTGRRIQDKQEKLDRINREILRLRTEIATLSAPDRIDARGRALGFHPARPDQITYLVVTGYPTGPAVLATAPAIPSTPDENWLDALLSRLGLNAGSRSAEATTGP